MSASGRLEKPLADEGGTWFSAICCGRGDGIIDLLETEPIAGTTMVPFHAEPASLEIPSKTYPTADAEGSIRYEQAVAVGELQEALRSKFNGAGSDLEKRVVFIHGMAPDAELPESAQSLPGVPS
jgi:hypothetical protein